MNLGTTPLCSSFYHSKDIPFALENACGEVFKVQLMSMLAVSRSDDCMLSVDKVGFEEVIYSDTTKQRSDTT